MMVWIPLVRVSWAYTLDTYDMTDISQNEKCPMGVSIASQKTSFTLYVAQKTFTVCSGSSTFSPDTIGISSTVVHYSNYVKRKLL